MTISLYTKIDLQLQSLSGGYAGQQNAVLVLIEDVAAHIKHKFGQVPTWEADELKAAKDLAAANFLKGAVDALIKALAIGDFSDDDYWGGYEYTHRGVERTSRYRANN